MSRTTCVMCGKRFYHAPEYIYKIWWKEGSESKLRYMCSYTCYRKAQRAYEKELRERLEQRRARRMGGNEA